MPQATIWNPNTGDKKVITVGSPMPSGYSLWTGGTATGEQARAAIINRQPPAGSVAINGATYNTRESQQTNFSNIQPIGGTLYGVPKIVQNQPTIPASALQQTEFLVDKPNLLDQNYWQQQYDSVETNLNEIMKPYYDQLATLNTEYGTMSDEYSKANMDRLNYQTETEKQNALTIAQPTLHNIGVGQANTNTYERSFDEKNKLLAEQNALTRLGLKQNQMEQLRTNANLQLQVQNNINTQKQNILAQANRLQDRQQELMANFVTTLVSSGVNIHDLPADVTGRAAQAFNNINVPWELVVATADAVRTQSEFDQIKDSIATTTETNNGRNEMITYNKYTGEILNRQDLGGAYKASGGSTPKTTPKNNTSSTTTTPDNNADVNFYTTEILNNSPEYVNDDGSVNWSAIPAKLRQLVFEELDKKQIEQSLDEEINKSFGDRLIEGAKDAILHPIQSFLNLF